MCRLCKDQAEHDSKVSAAKAVADRQRHYDLLHHQMRLRDFRAVTKPDHSILGLIKQSEHILENPIHGYNSVDCSDAEYIAELDAFAADQKAAA